MPDSMPAAPPSGPSPETCATCHATSGTSRYCAPGRCYCGHEACPAFDSYIDMSKVALPDAPTKNRHGSRSWDEREGSTWIDSL